MITQRTHDALAKTRDMEGRYTEAVLRYSVKMGKWRKRRIALERRIEAEQAKVTAVINRLSGGVSNAK